MLYFFFKEFNPFVDIVIVYTTQVMCISTIDIVIVLISTTAGSEPPMMTRGEFLMITWGEIDGTPFLLETSNKLINSI